MIWNRLEVMPRYHNIDGVRVQFTEEETARGSRNCMGK